MSIKFKAFAGCALLSAAIAAQAGIVNFDALASAGDGAAGDGITYSEAGLTFTSTYAAANALYHWGTNSPYNADPTGATLFQNYPGQGMVVTKTGGGEFFLDSFDLGDAYNSGATGSIVFSYVDGTGTHNSTLLLDSMVGLQTFTFGFSVTSFTLTQDVPYFQLDNVNFDSTAVPEPGSLALVGLALAGLASTARRARG